MNKIALLAPAAGVVSALFAMGVLTGRPAGIIFSFWSSLPLYVIGLMSGLGMTLVAGAVAAAIVGATQAMLFGQGLLGAGVFAIDTLLPAAVVAHLALRSRHGTDQRMVWYPGGSILSWLAVVFAGAFLALTVWAFLINHETVFETMRRSMETILETVLPTQDPVERAEAVRLVAASIPAMAGVSWLFVIVVNGILAQKALARLGWNLRPLGPLAVFQVPRWLVAPLTGAVVLALIGDQDLLYMGVNLGIVLAVPFFVQGLAVVHMYARMAPRPRVMLAIFYGCNIALGLPYAGLPSAVMLVGLGLVEQWAGLRSRMTGSNDWELE
jgi:hypothetical protein